MEERGAFVDSSGFEPDDQRKLLGWITSKLRLAGCRTLAQCPALNLIKLVRIRNPSVRGWVETAGNTWSRG